jgi:hypothetical protein
MQALIVRQSLKNGTIKTTKLRPEQKTHTFGSSRLADIISVSNETQGIQGVIEYKNGNWWYVDLDLQESFKQATSPTFRILKESTLKVGNCTLDFIPVHKEEDLFKRVENTTFLATSGKQFQLYIVRQNSQVVETRVLPLKKKFKPLGCNAFISPVLGEQWHNQTINDFEVRQKTISLEDVQAWAHVTPEQLVDEDSKKGLYVVFGAALFFLTVGIFYPKSQSVETVAIPPRIVQKILVKSEIKQKRQKIQKGAAAPVEMPENKTVAAAISSASAAPSAGGSKVSKLMKSIAGGRVSQLLGKVSASSAKSQNLIITNGIKAGTGASGRALAGLGRIEKSGRDWGNESGTSNVVISTAGRGGGKSSGKMGGLVAGSTGNAGVGLIEDEGEITGGLDREVIAQYIKSKLGQILYCYERQLSANPDLFGKVAVKFTISSSGAVDQQLVSDTTLKNATVEGCILNKISNWKFPTPQGGTKVVVTYPFLFKSTN